MGQFTTGTRLRLREFFREPTTVALLLALPPVVVETYGAAMSSFPQLPGVPGDPATTGRLTGALFATAFLAGLVGLFQVISARRGDERLHLCGFARGRLLSTRLVAVAAVVALAAAASLGVLSLSVDVGAPAAALGALALAGVVYGLLGVLVGAVLPRELEGSLVLVFLADFDNVLASGILDANSAVAAAAPLHHPQAVFEAAVTEGTVPAGHALWGGAYAALLFVLAFGVYVRVTGEGGVAA